MFADEITIGYFVVTLVIFVALLVLCFMHKRCISGEDFFTIVSWCVLWPLLPLIVVFGVVDYILVKRKMKKRDEKS